MKMKIKCDVCERNEASLYCVADEAVLCAACDHHVHHANKLAGKHQRFSFHQPSAEEAPLCDICQDKRALLFCQQDRAILCSECDIPIHKANEHTRNHTRFLFAGIKLAAHPTPYSGQPPNLADHTSSGPECAPPSAAVASVALEKIDHDAVKGFDSSGSTSSIADYLQMLPGCHVEDLLDSSSPFRYGVSKYGEDEFVQFWDEDEIHGHMSGFDMGRMGVVVPQVQPFLQQETLHHMPFELPSGFIEHTKHFHTTTWDHNNLRKRSDQDMMNSFAVPQINPPLVASKKSRSYY